MELRARTTTPRRRLLALGGAAALLALLAPAGAATEARASRSCPVSYSSSTGAPFDGSVSWQSLQ